MLVELVMKQAHKKVLHIYFKAMKHFYNDIITFKQRHIFAYVNILYIDRTK